MSPRVVLAQHGRELHLDGGLRRLSRAGSDLRVGLTILVTGISLALLPSGPLCGQGDVAYEWTDIDRETRSWTHERSWYDIQGDCRVALNAFECGTKDLVEGGPTSDIAPGEFRDAHTAKRCTDAGGVVISQEAVDVDFEILNPLPLGDAGFEFGEIVCDVVGSVPLPGKRNKPAIPNPEVGNWCHRLRTAVDLRCTGRCKTGCNLEPDLCFDSRDVCHCPNGSACARVSDGCYQCRSARCDSSTKLGCESTCDGDCLEVFMEGEFGNFSCFQCQAQHVPGSPRPPGPPRPPGGPPGGPPGHPPGSPGPGPGPCETCPTRCVVGEACGPRAIFNEFCDCESVNVAEGRGDGFECHIPAGAVCPSTCILEGDGCIEYEPLAK